MELYTVEVVVSKTLEMWRNHPELCPHDYEWTGTIGGVKYYRCKICGDEHEDDEEGE